MLTSLSRTRAPFREVSSMPDDAFIFPGQGSQSVDMFEPFYEEWEEAREAFDRIADEELSSLLFEADADELRQTANAQQAVFATGFVVSRALYRRFDTEPDIVAGHSLGHITAATVAGVLDGQDALELVRKRGEVMERAEREAGPGTMYAILFADPEEVADIVSDQEGVAIGGYNSPKQTVISGSTDAVEQTVDALEDRIARARATELDVHSGFHSPVMEPAVDPFAAALSRCQFSDPRVPVVSDMDGTDYQRGTQARQQYAEQLVSPVRWTDVVETLEQRGVSQIVVLPPADEIASLTERNTESSEIVALDAPRQP